MSLLCDEMDLFIWCSLRDVLNNLHHVSLQFDFIFLFYRRIAKNNGLYGWVMSCDEVTEHAVVWILHEVEAIAKGVKAPTYDFPMQVRKLLVIILDQDANDSMDIVGEGIYLRFFTIADYVCCKP